MANRKNKKTPKGTNKKGWSRKTKITVLCVSLAVLLVAGIVLGTVLYLNNRPFDYYKEDITKCLTIDTDAYKDFTVNMKLDAITDIDIDNRINQLLNANKSSSALNNGNADRNTEIKVGDIVTIFYRGYYMDEEKGRVEFDGGCNIEYSSGKVLPTTLTIGSGSYFSGFESDLIGKIPDQYANLTPVTEGVVEEGDVVYVSMTAILPGDRSFTNKTVRIDLADPDLEKNWGVGFGEFLVGKELRQVVPTAEFDLPETVEGQSKVLYTNIKPMFKSSDENKMDPIVVETYCPITHTEETLAGKTLYFEVYVRGTVHYDTPTLTESFIHDTLKLTDEDLAKYEGEDTIAKFRSYIKAELETGYYTSGNYVSGYQEKYDALLEELIWEKLNELTKIIKIPKRAIQPVYESNLASLAADYEYYKDTYGFSSVEEYIIEAMGAESIEEADDMLWYLSANAVREKMVVFHIAKVEGLLTDKESLKAEADELFKEVMDYYIENYYKDKFDKYETDEEYQEGYDELAALIGEEYTEDYLIENAIYDRVFEKLRTYLTVTLTGRGQN